MNHRQKLTINGISQWRSFGSLQELVNMVTEAVRAECQAQKNTSIAVKDYLMDWYHTYKEPQRSEGYRVNYICMINKHILPAIGDKPVSEVTVADVQGIP